MVESHFAVVLPKITSASRNDVNSHDSPLLHAHGQHVQEKTVKRSHSRRALYHQHQKYRWLLQVDLGEQLQT